MHYKVSLIFICLFQYICCNLFAQTSTFNGWFFSNHNQEITNKWSLLSDIQFRSGDQFKKAETILLRFGLQNTFTEKQSAAAGYAYLGNWQETSNIETLEPEHRIWEQYNLDITLPNTEMSHRLRLEQRYVQGDKGFDFSQRVRYYIRTQIPLTKNADLKKGTFLGLQNEVFLNVQHKDNVNNRFFDQNRAFVSFGYRFSKKTDVELGYLYRYQIEEEEMHNHILQMVVSTSL